MKHLLDQRLTTPIQQAWVAELMQYDYEIQYKHGKENVVVNTLCRIHSTELIAITTHILSYDLLDNIRHVWSSKNHLQKAIQAKLIDPSIYPKYIWTKDELRRKGKLVIGNDAALKTQLL